LREIFSFTVIPEEPIIGSAEVVQFKIDQAFTPFQVLISEIYRTAYKLRTTALKAVGSSPSKDGSRAL